MGHGSHVRCIDPLVKRDMKMTMDKYAVYIKGCQGWRKRWSDSAGAESSGRGMRRATEESRPFKHPHHKHVGTSSNEGAFNLREGSWRLINWAPASPGFLRLLKSTDMCDRPNFTVALIPDTAYASYLRHHVPLNAKLDLRDYLYRYDIHQRPLHH